ncbi:hypothetical protein CK203_005910 [Vitis vinifera]|uniref:Uncharacterized protein n=1 Tax=Vitis vinifera TaxID=29760 RepID=A0A438K5H7_VITVI|nr:hypothetical protein CK203_005910 [Vitis vinifera]
MKEVPRDGRRWFAVESKSFELLTDVVRGKLRGCIWERCRGTTSWIRFGDASLRSLLTGVETCCRGRDDRSRSLVWEEEEGSTGKGLSGGWNILAEKLREVGVVPIGGLKDPLSIELLKKEKDLEPRTYADVAKSKTGRLGDKVWLELGRRVMLGRLEQLDRCIVGRWENVSTPFPNEAECVLARGKIRVKDNVLFLEKWHPEVGCFCKGANVNEAWVRMVGLPLHLWSREVFKLIGDGCGGFIAVDENTDAMADLQWARMLVKVVSKDLPTSVQIVVGSGCFLVQLWWETPPWFSQVVPAGSLFGKGALMDEEEVGGGSRAVCKGRVLEKEVQYKEQTRVQVVSSCGSSSKSVTSSSTDSTERGHGPKVTDGENSLRNRGQGAGKVVKVGGHGFGPKGPNDGPVLWEAQIRGGLGEDSHETALVEIPLQGLVSESRPVRLKGWLMGCDERPFYLKGSLVGCKGLSGMGFGLGLGGIKGDRAHFHSKVAEMEVRAIKEASRTKVSEDEGRGIQVRFLSRYLWGGSRHLLFYSFIWVCLGFSGGGVSGSKGVDTVEGVGFQTPLCAMLTDGSPWVMDTEREKLLVISLRLSRHCRIGRFLAVVGMKVA